MEEEGITAKRGCGKPEDTAAHACEAVPDDTQESIAGVRDIRSTYGGRRCDMDGQHASATSPQTVPAILKRSVLFLLAVLLIQFFVVMRFQSGHARTVVNAILFALLFYPVGIRKEAAGRDKIIELLLLAPMLYLAYHATQIIMIIPLGLISNDYLGAIIAYIFMVPVHLIALSLVINRFKRINRLNTSSVIIFTVIFSICFGVIRMLSIHAMPRPAFQLPETVYGLILMMSGQPYALLDYVYQIISTCEIYIIMVFASRQFIPAATTGSASE